MSITEQRVPNEILIRYAEDGTIAGAHVAFLNLLKRDGVEVSRSIDGPHPMGTVAFPAEVILAQALIDALETIEQLNVQKAVLESQLTAQDSAEG
ncbi:MAG: hypothetical protein V7756_09500 [Halopseudomonas sp.]|uniref:hypothetical protein n=1 Tax=Halopseudomonas sp. TaxID=2901191 RepID=UPI00300198DD